MKYWNSKLLITTLLTVFSLAGCLSSETQAEGTQSTTTQFVEGKHYVEIFPEMNVDAPDGKIQVTELFWFGCPHCYSLEPTIKKYIKEKPDYVNFTQVPAALNPSWAFHAKAFYIAKIVDPDDKLGLIEKFFYAIHEQGRRLSSPNSVKNFFTQNGVAPAEYDKALNSMVLRSYLSNATTIGSASQATSVPSVIINGKYRTSPYMAGNEENLIKIINMLVEKERGS
jgi:thiol:disulfide interchange protein DsbA